MSVTASATTITEIAPSAFNDRAATSNALPVVMRINAGHEEW